MKEMSYTIRCKPIPHAVLEPRYEKMMSEKENRRQQNKANSI